ncbi:MAG: ATP synthase F1 subunit epsilon [Bacteroidetes bacterium]|nr:MAG: ATP synthase F1 subunit epsilon [Bacteroidota bacterium]
MLLEIISPDKKIYSGEVTSASFPGTEGSFGILKNHAPMVSTLKEGMIKIATTDNKEETFEINGGVVQVLNNRIIVLVE